MYVCIHVYIWSTHSQQKVRCWNLVCQVTIAACVGLYMCLRVSVCAGVCQRVPLYVFIWMCMSVWADLWNIFQGWWPECDEKRAHDFECQRGPRRLRCPLAFICVPWLVYVCMCDMTHSDLWHDSFWMPEGPLIILLSARIHMCDVTGACICVTQVVYMRDMTQSPICGVIRSYVWHDPSTTCMPETPKGALENLVALFLSSHPPCPPSHPTFVLPSPS